MHTLRLAHPWHGIPLGKEAPDILNVFVEMVPSDTAKYEVDKETGHLRLDRPQKYSNFSPAPYGFIPRTYCGDRIAQFTNTKTGRKDLVGDADPLDICVLTERPISHGAIIVKARPIGGIRFLDHGEADDKIIGILADDPAYGHFQDLKDVPRPILDRLCHYFLTYKQMPEEHDGSCSISGLYGREEALKVIDLAIEDYQDLITKTS